jgi:mannosylglycerate hydrolase MGH1-like protein/glycosyl hydrolase family 63
MVAAPYNPEKLRLQETRERNIPWKKWGPYLSERQWGTVREDYSRTGNAWDYFSHDQARSRAYRWGEDGLAGISDDRQQLCFAIALWNGVDPILKERLFGLTNSEGNHGEDVKEYYFYLDSTPTHSYMKYLYKYPQHSYPYADLVATNRRRGRLELEYELLDTGIFDDDRYFDVFVEYAKQSPEDLLIRIHGYNRGPDAATLHLLPHLWFRNTWWNANGVTKPTLRQVGEGVIAASHPALGERYLYCQRADSCLFTDNETNLQRLFGRPNESAYVKDGINDYIVQGKLEAVNSEKVGTKSAAHYILDVPGGGLQVVQLRLTDTRLSPGTDPFSNFDSMMQARQQEADAFYQSMTPANTSDDVANVMRQAFAGMLWTKQFYYYPVQNWIEDKQLPPDAPNRFVTRNRDWFYLESARIFSMPDKWEYPWFAAWDLAFHCIVLAQVDIDFAKEQLQLITNQVHLHPNGQIPAYEWNFSDVNPPVHCMATWQVYLMDKVANSGKGDRYFLESVFHKLMMNFTWWVNRKDAFGNNVFEGGFLGLDNIGVFDRSATLPTGGTLEQADGTSWMAMYCLDMLTIALELAVEDPVYEEMACKFYEHFVYIAAAMDRIGLNNDELWDEDDGFFYDVLQHSDGNAVRIKVRSMVGLIPLFPSCVFTADVLAKLPTFAQRLHAFNEEHPELFATINDPRQSGVQNRFMLAIVDRNKLRRILEKMLDETEFFSDYGIRALSRYHKDHPYLFYVGRDVYRVDYEPAESSTGLFGGNSNWRGPIWMPVNHLLLQSLRQFYSYYGDDFQVECPTGSGKQLTLWQVADVLDDRLLNIFRRNAQGHRPVYGHTTKFQTDPHWRDLILFYEYFHGDNGAGIGASHQTGWTGLMARTIQIAAAYTAQDALAKGYFVVSLQEVQA